MGALKEFDPAEWAVQEAARLRAATRQEQYQGSSGRGVINLPPTAAAAHAEAASALEFLRQWNRNGDLYRAAREGVTSSSTAKTYLEQLAGVLDQFVAGRSSGLLTALPFEVRSRAEAATDLMEQVARLLDDREVHVAAPVALAGAALEELLRSLWFQADEPKLAGKPGLRAYATALRAAGVLDRTDVKDISAWAGLRNDAAHGNFDSLSIKRAHTMADGINHFMRRLIPRG